MSGTEGERPKFRILVVDDHRDGADSLALLLRVWGYEVLAVYDARQAIEAAKEFKPDCILSDIGLPGMDGYQLAELFRQDESLKSLPLVAITAYSDAAKAKEAGFDYHLVKPADPLIVEVILQRLRVMGQKQGEVVEEVRDLVKEVREDVKEIKEGLQEEVKELKQELREVKEEVKEIKEDLRKDNGDG